MPRIELRSETSGEPVDAIVERTAVEHARQLDDPTTSTASAMEPPAAVASPPPPPPALPVQQKPSDAQQRHESVPAQPSPAPIAPRQQQQTPSDRSGTQPPMPPRPYEHAAPAATPVNGHVQANHHRFPVGHDIAMEAVHRIQTQNSYNTAALQAVRGDFQRDIQRVDAAVARLQADMMSVCDAVRSIREELQVRPWLAQQQQLQPPAPVPQTDDRTIEYLAENLQGVSAKANEVDGLKIQIEMLKRKVRRLEENGPGPAPGAFPAPLRDGSVHQAPVPVAIPVSQMPFVAAPAQAQMRPLSSHMQHPPPPPPPQPMHTPDAAPPAQPPEAQPSGWVSVNPSIKRGHPNGVDDRTNGAGTPLGSPKRPKLAPIEPRRTYDAATPVAYDRVDTEESGAGFRTNSHDPHAAPTNPSRFIPFKAASEGNPDDGWRAESQRPPLGPMQEPRSPKRGGRGGPRGPRGRKSLPSELDTGTPEWERSDWSGSPAGPDGLYQPITPSNRRGIPVRRGSGGGGSASARQMAQDPYAHTKKSRTKPIRNAEGILIRKDGRPDMRSQSSAANLRKVHARKEQERAQEQGHTPTSGLATAPVIKGDGSSTEDEEEPSTQERHEAIMRKMFPRGIDEQRGRMNYAEQFFPPASSPIETKMQLQKEIEREMLMEEAESAEMASRNAHDEAPAVDGAGAVDGQGERAVRETQQARAVERDS